MCHFVSFRCSADQHVSLSTKCDLSTLLNVDINLIGPILIFFNAKVKKTIHVLTLLLY